MKSEPIWDVLPAMVSRRGVTVLVAEWAALRACAMRVRAEGRGEEPVKPGLGGLLDGMDKVG